MAVRQRNQEQSPGPSAKPTVSVVVPVYNSEPTVRALVEKLWPVLTAASEQFEAIFVNDGSRDGSWQIIEQLSERYPGLHGIDLMRNYGQHNALLCGIRQARYDVIVTLDDDLQNPPEEIPRLLAKLAEGPFDVVYGQPLEERHGWWRDGASRLTKLALASTLGAQTARQVSAFRAFRSILRQAFVDYQGSYVNVDVLLGWGTTRFAAVPVRHDRRQAGSSNYSFAKLAVHALNMITGFSTVPLQFASLMGFAFTLLGFVVLVYVVGRYIIQGGSVPGFPFLASVIAIFSGAQLFALGIIGEYVARMHVRLMSRPTYSVRQASHGGDQAVDPETVLKSADDRN